MHAATAALGPREKAHLAGQKYQMPGGPGEPLAGATLAEPAKSGD
jgi:hypothetical protein